MIIVYKGNLSLHHEMIHPVWQRQSLCISAHDHRASSMFKGLSWNIFLRAMKNQREERYCGKRVLYDIQSPEKPYEPYVTDVLNKYANVHVQKAT